MLARDRRRKALNSNHLLPSASRPVLHSLEPVPGPDKWEGLRQEGHPALKLCSKSMNMGDTDLNPARASPQAPHKNTAVHLRKMDYGSRITSGYG